MKSKKNISKILVIFAFVFFVMFCFNNTFTFADYGDFESYDSGSSWDSDWDSGSSYSYSSSSGGTLGSFITVVIIFIIIGIYISKVQKNGNIIPYNTPQGRAYTTVNQEEVENKIQETDPLFNKDEFLSWASDLFVKLQYAWSDRNLESIRAFETPELYEQTQEQVDRYIKNKQINVLERVSVNFAKLYKFERQGDRDNLTIMLESKMIDYIIDEDTRKIIKGDTNNKYNHYLLTFVRNTGTKTREDGAKVETMNCPNCGAPTEITSSGKCPYCGSVITTDDHGWSLASLKRFNPNM